MPSTPGWVCTVERHRIDIGGETTEHFEGELRRHLYNAAPGTGAAKGFEWDNVAPHRYGLWGPGTPTEIPKGEEIVHVLAVQADRVQVLHEGDAKVTQWVPRT